MLHCDRENIQRYNFKRHCLKLLRQLRITFLKYILEITLLLFIIQYAE